MKKEKTSSGIRSFKFPRISRFIPEKGNSARKFYFIVYACMAIALFLVSFELTESLIQYNKAKLERDKIEAELAFWSEVSNKFPGYRDAYFNVAVLEYRLGDKSEAKRDLDKTLNIDPNFEKGRELERLL